MGRLIRRFNKMLPAKFDLRGWVLPVLAALVLVLGVHRGLASPIPSSAELANYLQSNTLSVSTGVFDGYQQVFYFYGGNSIYVTDEKTNYMQPVTSGRYIAWVKIVDGAGQIELYNVLNGASLQLTNSGTNIKPAISGNRVVWEGWRDEKWHIFYFDGSSVRRLSSSKLAIRPSIRGDEVIYAEEASQGEWQVIKHNIATNSKEVIAEGGENNAWPVFKPDGSISTRFEDKFIQ